MTKSQEYSHFSPVVAIDGTSGCGKSTLARKVAGDLQFLFLDTGALFRGIAVSLQHMWNQVIDLNFDPSSVEHDRLLDRELQRVRLIYDFDRFEQSLALKIIQEKSDGTLGEAVDVSEQIRLHEVSQWASRLSQFPCVRRKVLLVEREVENLAIQQNIGLVAEGRDLGTIVYPNAFIKFFLSATPEERAKRRWLQLHEAAASSIPSVDEILASQIERDRRDEERAIAPLVRAMDAILIETTELSIDEVYQYLLQRTLLAVKEIDPLNYLGVDPQFIEQQNFDMIIEKDFT